MKYEQFIKKLGIKEIVIKFQMVEVTSYGKFEEISNFENQIHRHIHKSYIGTFYEFFS